MMDFDKAFELVVGAEGVYSDDPRDYGNWTDGKAKGSKGGVLMGTKYGISARVYGEALRKSGVTIKDLTADQAKDIYKIDYWGVVKCDKLPEQLRYPVFSCAVNCGTTNAAKILQRTVLAIVDGVVGSATIKAARYYRDINGLVEDFCHYWRKHYEQIVENDESQRCFLNGWIARIKEVQRVNATV